MPHRVSNFLRTSSGNSAQFPKKQSRSRNTSPYSSSASRRNSSDTSPTSSTSHLPHSVKMPDLADTIKKRKLPNPLNFARSSSRDRRGSAQKNKENAGPANVALDWRMESPPIVFHGNAEDSTGALVSGQMFLEVKDDEAVDIESFKGSLRIHTTQKRPFQGHCHDCTNQYQDVATWTFLGAPATLKKGSHSYPFSVLLPGNLPATMDTTVMSIAWEFKAEAKLCNPQNPNISVAKFQRTLTVKRSVPEPEVPHHSVRVFPPTNIKASANYTSVIHPSGNNKVTFRLDGLVSHNEKVKTIDLWKLKKLTWKLEETVSTTAPACDRHSLTAPTPQDPNDVRGLTRSEVRLLGEKSLYSGWKSDFDGADGKVELEFDYSINQCKPNSRELKFACDSSYHPSSPLHPPVSVTHSLLIELVVSKEFAPEGKANLSQPTGTGRILRMHYGVVMTDHPGMGVSWDNEAPPTYEDVPPSPPGYEAPKTPENEPDECETLETLEARRASVEPLDLTIMRTNE